MSNFFFKFVMIAGGISLCALSFWRASNIFKLAFSQTENPYFEGLFGVKWTKEDNPILFWLKVTRGVAVWLLIGVLGFVLVIIAVFAGKQV